MMSGSLKEAYSLAHTAQCRLQMEANRPDRNLRFVVGHLMHYESLRLRIVEIEHDEHLNPTLPAKNTNRLSAEGEMNLNDENEDAYEDEDGFDDEDEMDYESDGLGLTRFPSGAGRARPVPPPDVDRDHNNEDDDDDNYGAKHDAEYDNDDDDEVDEEDEDDPEEPISPPLSSTLPVDPSTLVEYYIRDKQDDGELTSLYNGVRACPCHGPPEEIPLVTKMWQLPPENGRTDEKGIMRQRAIAQVA